MTKKERRQIGRNDPSYLNGGFRTGKRKRGTSLLRVKPRASVVVTTYVMQDDHGNTVGRVNTLKYIREQ